LKLIEENYQNHHSVNEYAEMLAITPNHLTQVVKDIMGKTSVKLLKEKIVTEAKRLLLHTNLSVTQIADALHFPDQSYFTKYFKQEAGCSPIEFRRNP
jgi:AraC family transcriptional activator of pobA